MKRLKRHFPLYLVIGSVITLWTMITGARAIAARAELRNRIATERSTIARLAAQADRLQTAQSQANALDQNTQQLLRCLTSAADGDKLVAQVRQIEEINCLSISSLKTVASATAGPAVTRTISLKVTGGFNGFYAGLLQIESLSPSVLVTDVCLDRLDQTNAELQGEVTIRLLLRPEHTPMLAGVSP